VRTENAGEGGIAQLRREFLLTELGALRAENDSKQPYIDSPILSAKN